MDILKPPKLGDTTSGSTVLLLRDRSLYSNSYMTKNVWFSTTVVEKPTLRAIRTKRPPTRHYIDVLHAQVSVLHISKTILREGIV